MAPPTSSHLSVIFTCERERPFLPLFLTVPAYRLHYQLHFFFFYFFSLDNSSFSKILSQSSSFYFLLFFLQIWPHARLRCLTHLFVAVSPASFWGSRGKEKPPPPPPQKKKTAKKKLPPPIPTPFVTLQGGTERTWCSSDPLIAS